MSLALILLAAQAAAPAPAKAPDAPQGMQWLYGSGEGSAASLQTFRALEDYVTQAKKHRPKTSVVLAEGSTLAEPRFMPCTRRMPLAVILDADETALQNQGYEYALASRGKVADRDIGTAWQVKARNAPAMPGAVAALNAIRKLGVTVIYNSNRDNWTGIGTAATLEAAGLGPAVYGRTLFLRGDVDGKSSKDGRRWHVASQYCVVALGGDQLGDFSELLNDRNLSVLERRAAASTGAVGGLWGNGWFILSNPAYGSGLRGSLDEVFAPDQRWNPDLETEKK